MAAAIALILTAIFSVLTYSFWTGFVNSHSEFAENCAREYDAIASDEFSHWTLQQLNEVKRDFFANKFSEIISNLSIVVIFAVLSCTSFCVAVTLLLCSL